VITKQKTLFYFVGDQAFKSLEGAQKADLLALMPKEWTVGGAGIAIAELKPEHIANWLLTNSVAITDCLTTTPRSRSKARKANGGTRKRKAKQVTAPGDPGTKPAA
jgi:hypothetical protein